MVDKTPNFKYRYERNVNQIKKAKEPQPLIPSYIIDTGSQKAYFTGIFLLIQAFKIQQCLIIKSHGNSGLNNGLNYEIIVFIVKFFFIDSGFLWLLPVFRIPGLTFNPFIIFLQSISITGFTIFLSCNFHILVTSVISSVFGLVHFPGESHGSSSVEKASISPSVQVLGSNSEILKDELHFKGQKIINIVPKSTSYFNPFHEQYCLDLTLSKMTVPVKFNSSNELSYIEILYVDYNNKSTTVKYKKDKLIKMKVEGTTKTNYLRKDLILNGNNNFIDGDIEATVASIDSSRITFLEVPVEKPGLYRVHKAIDDKNLPIKVYGSSLIVSTCPTARIESDSVSHHCLGDRSNMKISIHGVPPLRVKYKKFMNEISDTEELKLLLPEVNVNSPLISQATLLDNESGNQFSLNELLRNLDRPTVEKFSIWANSYDLTIDLDSVAKVSGDFSLQLEEVEDGFGNIVNLSRVHQQQYRFKYQNKFETLEDYLKSQELYLTYTVYESPKLKLVDRLSNKPLMDGHTRELKLVINGHDHNEAQNQRLLEKFEPILAQVSYVSESGKKSVQDYEFSSKNQFKFFADEPGAYNLDSVTVSQCPGVIDDSNSKIDIYQAFKPSLSILSNSSITDKCLGQTGLNFDLSLSGVPPFEIKVLSFKNNNGEVSKIDTKRVRVASSNRFQYNYEPKNEGDYQLRFDSIRDSVYADFIELSPAGNFTFYTSLKQKPDANFLDISESKGQVIKKLCLGSELEILPIKLSGEAPYEISYEIMEKKTNRRKGYNSKVITHNIYDLKLPIFKHGGTYIVSLTSVKDKSGCVVVLDGQQVTVNVNQQLPYTEFKVSPESHLATVDGERVNQISIKEGTSVQLPVKLVGEKNVQVNYKLLDYNKNVIGDRYLSSFHNHQNKAQFIGHITAEKAGTYYLTEVRDSYCIGHANSLAPYNVSYFSKPLIIIREGPTVSKVRSNEFQKQGLCLNEEHNTVDLEFKGKAPFVLDYDIELPNGARIRRSIKALSNIASVNIWNDLKPEDKITGQYTYRFKSISDAIYAKQDLNHLSNYKFQVQSITQNLMKVPDGKFVHKHKLVQTCSSNLNLASALEPLVFTLSGSAPFEVHLELYNENYSKYHNIVLKDIESSKLNLNEKIVSFLTTGNHFITVKKVIDGKGCEKVFPRGADLSTITSRNSEELLDTQTLISIADVPKITKLTGASDLCIGDTVNYKIQGNGPFFVQYLFNKVKGTTKISNVFDFKRQLVEPGQLQILSVVDAFNCKIDLDEQQRSALEVTVHDKPSVEIINSSLENIQEGDEVNIIFKFTGTAPFNLIYRRSFNNFKDFEIYHVNNIESNEYTIKTSLQGSYDAIEVKDVFCEIRRHI